MKEDTAERLTLLSCDEYTDAIDYVPYVDSLWWLRSPGWGDGKAAYVSGRISHSGRVMYSGIWANYELGVRPALKLEPQTASPKAGEKIEAAGHSWTVIQGSLALCDEIVGKVPFRINWEAPDASLYEASDVRRWLQKWGKEKGIS